MGAQLGSKGAMSEINMTPLIDIVLVVLIIMMVNIPIQIEQMGVKLPSDVEVKPKQDPPADQLVIAIYEDGSVALNRRLMTEEVLFYEVTRRLRPMAKKNVFLDAFPTARYGQVVEMMDLAREAGASKVALARLKETGPLAANSVAPGAMPRGVIPGSPRVVGALSEKKADAAFKPILPKLKGCFDSRLALNPELNGRVVLAVGVGPDGEIMSTEVVSDTVADAGLIECIMPYAEAIPYEPLGREDDGTGKTGLVHYPVLFSSG